MHARNSSQAFSQWSQRWKELREHKHLNDDIDSVLEMWRTRVPKECLRESWGEVFEYRHNHKSGLPRGEQIIEKQFLNPNGPHELRRASFPTVRLKGVAHKMALATRRKGQVIPDCLGIIELRDVSHPVAVEIKQKRSAGDIWFAVVENLQQVRMLRGNVRNLGKFFKARDHVDVKGAWGMVLAPKDYFDTNFAATEELLQRLNRETNARIMLVASDGIGKATHLDLWILAPFC